MIEEQCPRCQHRHLTTGLSALSSMVQCPQCDMVYSRVLAPGPIGQDLRAFYDQVILARTRAWPEETDGERHNHALEAARLRASMDWNRYAVESAVPRAARVKA